MILAICGRGCEVVVKLIWTGHNIGAAVSGNAMRVALNTAECDQDHTSRQRGGAVHIAYLSMCTERVFGVSGARPRALLRWQY